ncbi:hypothetical protein Tco_1338700 [Tanacetum coccineum]
MRTRSQSRNLNRQQQQASPAFVEPFDLEEPIENPDPPIVTMADNRTMAQLLETPTEGYEGAIVVLEITADNFELKHDHFYDEVPERLEFQQRFDETFYEAWDRFNDLLRACPHHGFSEFHQLDTLYNALNSNDQDSLNSAAGGNFLDKIPRDCLRIIESKSKVRNSRNKSVVEKVSSSTPGISPDVTKLKDMVKALLLDKKSQAPTPVKAVEESCVTCGGAHSYRNCPATNGNVYRDNIQEYVSQAAAANYNQGNTGYRAPIANQIRPPGFPPVIQPPAYQAPPYQAPAPQTQGVTKTDFESYVKANDAGHVTGFSTGVTPLQTRRKDLKVITTRSGVGLSKDPRFLLLPYSPITSERNTEVKKDSGASTNNGKYQRRRTSGCPILPQYQILSPLCSRATETNIPIPEFPNFTEILLKDRRALIECLEREQHFHVGKEAVTFNLDQTSSGNPAPYYDPVVSTSSSTLTPFGDSDFLLLEETDAFLALEDDPTLPEVDESYYTA